MAETRYKFIYFSSRLFGWVVQGFSKYFTASLHLRGWGTTCCFTFLTKFIYRRAVSIIYDQIQMCDWLILLRIAAFSLIHFFLSFFILTRQTVWFCFVFLIFLNSSSYSTFACLGKCTLDQVEKLKMLWGLVCVFIFFFLCWCMQISGIMNTESFSFLFFSFLKFRGSKGMTVGVLQEIIQHFFELFFHWPPRRCWYHRQKIAGETEIEFYRASACWWRWQFVWFNQTLHLVVWVLHEFGNGLKFWQSKLSPTK